MGYESRVYIVQEHDPWIKGELAYGHKLAMFDLCKMGYEPINGKRFWELFNQERTCYFYSDDDTQIVDDYYGDPIQKADNKELIRWLRKALKAEPYWRAKALLSCLESLEKSGEAYSVYHFGY